MMATMMSLMDTGKGGGDDGGMQASPLMAAPAASSTKDKLNLSGLLNVLDGVVDTPERILIMTTNHPEQLDPALIRPGRIDKKILLGYMSPAHATSMINHYFQCEVNAEQRERLRLAIIGNDEKGLAALNLTPAQVEQLCAEHEAVEAMVCAVEGLGGITSKAAAPGTSSQALPLVRGPSATDRPAMGGLKLQRS